MLGNTRTFVTGLVVFGLGLACACSEFPTRPGEVSVDAGDAGDLGGTGDTPETDLPEDERCTTDAQCDDGVFCNGAERCVPQADRADARGCLAGEPIQTDDGIECTRDGCDEARKIVTNDPEACACAVAGDRCDCASFPENCPQNVPSCHIVLCTEQLTCAARPVPRGGTCNDGYDCTENDVCDGLGTCAGTPVDSRCDDLLFCTGQESCEPLAPGAGEDGCLQGAPPPLDDGLDCTQDRCDEDRDEVLHIATDCQSCESVQDCVADSLVPCRRLVCEEGTCSTAPLTDGEPCDDTFSCTSGDACDETGTCRGTPTDDACNDLSWCNGVEACLPQDPSADARGCVAGPSPQVPDGVDCTDDVCVECPADDCTPGLEGTFRYEPTERCECVTEVDCSASTCRVPLCDPGNFTCGTRLAEVGTSCQGDDLCIDGQQCGDIGQCEGGTDVCECRGAEDCPDLGPCLQPTCDEGRCGSEPTGQGVSCVSPDPCLENTTCDGEGACVGEDACECREDTDCNTGPCIGSRRCVEGSCAYLFQERGTPCGEDDGCTRRRCDGEGVCLADLVHDLCGGGCRAARCDPENNEADDDGCVFGAEVPNGTTCDSDCRQQEDDGVCYAGLCRPRPEGPTGNAECRDRADNDCDGIIDGEEVSCALVQRVTLSGTTSLPAGFGVHTTTLEAVPRTRDDSGVEHQNDNVYCTARHVAWETEFEEGSIAGDPMITPSPGAELNDLIDGGDPANAQLCNGHGIDLGPFPFPSAEEGIEYTYMLELTTGTIRGAPLGVGEHLVVGYRTELVPGGNFLPLLALSPAERGSTGRYRFILDNPEGASALTVRLWTMVQGPGTCAALDSVRVYTVPRIARDGEADEWRDHLQWRYGDVTETAFQDFELGTDTETFFDILSGDSSIEVDVDGRLIGDNGVEWKYSNAPLGLVTLPSLVAHPDSYDRSNPLIYDFGAFDDDATYLDQRELWHQVAIRDDPDHKILASVLPNDIPWIEHHNDLDDPEDETHRFLVPLPEEMKVLGRRRLGMRAHFDGTRDSDALMDETHVYWFTRPGIDDVRVRVLPPDGYNESELPVHVESRRRGVVLVRCFWQVPDDPDYPTIESLPHYVRFE